MFKYDKQFSPIRSGSTLVYNLVRDCIPYQITKTHAFGYGLPNVLYIISVRHPYNSIISSCLRKNEEINDENIQGAISEYLIHGGAHLSNVDPTGENVLVLYYEKFVDDFDYIFDHIEKKCSVTIDSKKRDLLKHNNSIESVKNKL